MSVKLVYSSEPSNPYRDDSGYCYCRRNAAAIHKGKPERKTVLPFNNEPIQATINFGSVAVESTQFHEFVLTSSTLNFPVKIVEDSANSVVPIDAAFRFVAPAQLLPSCAVPDRLVKTNSKLSFRIYFEPELPGMHYTQTIELLIGGIDGIPVQINCRGDAFGPALCFSENQINFGGQYYRDETKRSVKLINLSDCEAKFQFDLDNPRSTFKVCPTAGVVPPQTTLKLELTFLAPKPQAYYKRLICFVLHQQPQFIDLFGVCIPRPFMPPVAGIGFALSSFRTQFLPLPSLSTDDDYLDNARRWGLNLSSDQIDFGYRLPDPNLVEEYEPLSMSSTLPYDCIIEWTSDASEVFVVNPQSAILPANRSTLFQVHFRPTFPNVFYSGLLECFVHPTGYNWPAEFGPPWSDACRNTKMDLVPEVTTEAQADLTTNEETDMKDEESTKSQTDLRSSSSSGKSKTKDRHGRQSHWLRPSKPSSRSPKSSTNTVQNMAENKSDGEDEVDQNVILEEETTPNMPVSSEALAASYFKFRVNLSHVDGGVLQSICLEPISLEAESIPEVSPGESDTDEVSNGSQKCQMPKELGLPLCVTLRVLGHTYQKPPPVTTIKLPSRVIMDVTWPMRGICRTICFHNPTDFPVHFDVTSIEEHGVYRVKPSKGVIPGNFHQLALVYMMPNSPEALVYIQNSNILVNLADRNKVKSVPSKTISLCGLAEVPGINWVRCYLDFSAEGTNGLQFPMTVPKFESTLMIQLVNPTRFYCKFSLMADDDDDFFDGQKIFEPTPSAGVIEPYERVDVTWAFHPEELLRYTQNWKCIFDVQLGRVEPKERLPHFEFKFPVSGLGESCRIQAFPTLMDYGLVELYTKQTMTFTLTNRGNAVVHLYFLAIHEQWLQNFPSEQLSIKPPSVTVQGQESVEIEITIRPYLMTMERFSINYSMSKDYQKLDDTVHLCSVRFIGDHPVVQVTDVNHSSLHPICDGTFAWSMFSLDKLNKFLGHGSHSFAQEGRLRPPPTVAFNFPPAPIGSESAIFTLLLANKGKLGTSWEIYKEPPKQLPQFLMDDNSSLATFNGDDPTDPNFLSSLWSRRIIDKYRKSVSNLDPELTRRPNICFSVKPFRDVGHFKVLPLSSQLEPKDQVQISFRYVYKSVGFHDMYFLLWVNPSIFIWLHVKGRTLELDKPFVQHFYDQEVKFVPVSLTDMDPPIQLIWLYNGGTVPAKFQINRDRFIAYKNENFGHFVFDLVDERGLIPPRSWGTVKVRFSPIEIRDYNLDLIVQWGEGCETLVRLHGSPLIHQTTLMSPTELGILFAERYSLLLDPIVPFSITPTHVTIKHFIPTGQQDTTIIFLTNLSENHEISFDWPETTEIDGGGSIAFRPKKGTVPPNGKVACQLVIRGGNAAVMCTSLINCTITDLTELTICTNFAKKWETSKTFLLGNKINEMEANARLLKKFGQYPEPYEASTKVISVTVYITSSFGMLDYNKTFQHNLRPPITHCKPLPAKRLTDIQGQPDLTLPPFAQQLSREVLRTVLWDIVHSEPFEHFVKYQSGWKAPTFNQYMESETLLHPKLTNEKITMKNEYTKFKQNQNRNNWNVVQQRFPLFGSHDVLKEVLFNLVTELDGKFEANLPQPIALGRVLHQQLFPLDEIAATNPEVGL